MGNVFTPKAIGQFTISLTTENGRRDESYLHISVDTKSPEFKLLGEVPSYSKNMQCQSNNPDAFIIIPEVSIIDKGTLKEYSVKVVDNNGQGSAFGNQGWQRRLCSPSAWTEHVGTIGPIRDSRRG